MQKVKNSKTKIAFKMSEAISLNCSPGDRLILDQVGKHDGDGEYVAYIVPRERFLEDFEVVK